MQTSPISFHPRKRDVCETASLIVFQYPAVFQEFVESAFIGCLTIATVRNNSDWLSSGNARDNVCDLHLAGFSIDKNMSDCVLCFSTILKNNDRNLVKSRSEFKVQEEILSLQFIVHETSPYICRSCVGKLRKRRGLYANVRKIEDELFSDYSSKAFKAGLTVKKKIETLGKDSVGTSASPEKRILLEESVDRSSNDLSSLVTSTPVKAVRNASVRKIQIPPLSPVRPPIMERSEGNDSGTENKTVLS